MSQFDSIDTHNIYSDLMLAFINCGHRPFIVSPYEKRFARETQLLEFADYTNLTVKVENMSGVSLIKKGLSTIGLGHRFTSAVKKYFSGIKFDLILYSTPPITIAGVVKKQKARHHAPAYLLLKDIFPQNAVDLGMLRKGGLLHRYFRQKEKQLYALSDNIGCMSPANMAYLLAHNTKIAPEKVSVCPNSIIPKPLAIEESLRQKQREKYGIPQEAVVFIYGGNMGAPQDIPFAVQCLKQLENRWDCYFIMCGTGTCYNVLERYVKERSPGNILLINGLPKAEYDALLMACDIGMLFLDHRFTIPNFPSRMLSYMEQSMPIFACTDCNTDVGRIITDGGFGWWCQSSNPSEFKNFCEVILTSSEKYAEIGAAGRRYLEEFCNADICCRSILGSVGL